MAIEVIIPGALTTIQDKGRFGYLKSGITTSGVMDNDAYMAALKIMNLDKSDILPAVLECTVFGPTIKFLEDTCFTLTGADMQARLNDIPVNKYKLICASAGDILSLGMAVNGSRAYIAFGGGIDVPLVMGSRSTNMKCLLGGYEGRKLKTGDVINVVEYVADDNRENNNSNVPDYSQNIVVRVILGPQDDMFSQKGLDTFFESEYTLSDNCDRMGYRLEGNPIESKNGVDIVSDGIAFGSIQILPNGKPIILLADRQTTGGYAKIATVVSSDIPKLAQLLPGAKIKFKKFE